MSGKGKEMSVNKTKDLPLFTETFLPYNIKNGWGLLYVWFTEKITKYFRCNQCRQKEQPEENTPGL
jgi:hypothetical protein